MSTSLRHNRTVAVAAVAALAAGALGLGAAHVAVDHYVGSPTASTSIQAPAGTSDGSVSPFGGGAGSDGTGGSGSATGPGAGGFGSGAPGAGGFGSGGSGSGDSGSDSPSDNGSSSGGAGSTTTQATKAQVKGIVNIITKVDYGAGEAAGTGMVISADGLVLTNNHVVEGSTSIQVTDLTTDKTYTATVVGTSPTNDLAVIRLKGASGLATAAMGSSARVAVGDAVVGVGNAGNEPGTAASPGTVTALDQAITASDGASSEHLTGLIQTNAGIEAGDSGGPLYAADGTVIGINTAAHTGQSGATVAGYAIPIDHALDIARQITSGVDNATIHQGLPAFLGVTVARATSGATGSGVPVAGVIAGSAAAKAGITAGSRITALDGARPTSASALTKAITAHNPGDRVRVTWTDAGGTAHSATVTLGSGPAD